ncbi:hypothetical protein SAMCFNEI73_pC2010 (plasmid) [Sinorhizobium americanum]|uniref:Uncharacterized protein n=1 Tax=Sinorhizobium americanum TaxID=194963 RepID=A0A1L3M059_9HYPH|nr:hypothetical protein SAMCCGM7_pC2137 [Sinorhizobium americanum CCGM7]APG95708.1 hypothetical protein SAMCFNEI73_pC2010 [Sinorhizobium americanum]
MFVCIVLSSRRCGWSFSAGRILCRDYSQTRQRRRYRMEGMPHAPVRATSGT